MTGLAMASLSRMRLRAFTRVGILIALAGCGPKPSDPIVEPQPLDDSSMSVVITRVNANAAGMDFLLRAGGVRATGEYERNNRHETFDLNGVMLFRRPRDLYLKLDHLGPAIEAGSNEQEFWFWEKLGDQRYSWGRHDAMGDQFNTDIPLRPDLLADVLGLGDLPDPTTNKDVLMWKDTDRYGLIFQSRDVENRAYITKRVDIDRSPPYLVKLITYLRRDGQPIMQAELSEYKQVTSSSVLVPTRIRIDWLGDRGWAELTFEKVERFDQPRAAERFISPRERDLLSDIPQIRLDREPVSLPPLETEPDLTTPLELTPDPVPVTSP